MSRKFIATLAMMTIVFSAGIVGAQTFSLTVDGPSSVGQGFNFDATVILDFTGPDSTSGWSYGICNDPAAVTFVSEVDGMVPMTAGENGEEVEFNTKSSFPEGYNVGVVICITGCAVLAPGSDYELTIGTYTAGPETPSTLISPCDTIGTPPVATVIVINGQSVIPDMNALDVQITGIPDPAYTYGVPNTTADYNPADGLWSTTVDVTIDQDDNGAIEVDTQGFSMGMTHDPTLAQVDSIIPLGQLASINDGDGPDFFEVGLTDTNGWTLGVVNAITGGIEFPLQNEAVVQVAYSSVTPSPLAGDETGTTMALTFTDTVGTPPVVNVVVVGGGSIAAGFDNGSVALTPVLEVVFRRGDVNDDSLVNIADAIWILNELFQEGPLNSCGDAGDANNDQNYDASDTVYIINYRFLGGPPPATPFPNCGPFEPDSGGPGTGEPLGCDSFDSC